MVLRDGGEAARDERRESPSLLDLEDGFLALPRRLCGSALFESLRADERYVVVTMLLRARYAPGEFYFGGRRYELAPGQFIDSEETLARAAGSTRKVIRTVYRKLEVPGLVTRERVSPAGQCPSVTTIVDYKRILFVPREAGPRTDPLTGQEGAKNGPANGPLTGQEGAPCEQGNKGTLEPPASRRARVILGPLGSDLIAKVAVGLGSALAPLSQQADADELEQLVADRFDGVDNAYAYIRQTCRARSASGKPYVVCTQVLVLEMLRDVRPAAAGAAR